MTDTANPPACLGPRTSSARPSPSLPAGTWDTHFHVFGPRDRFPYATKRKYTPPESPFEAYVALAARLGIERAVCVHPNLHGPDNAVTLDALRRSDGRFIGIVKLDHQATFEDLQAMDRAGIRGVRFAFNPEHGGELDPVLFERASRWCAKLGWCIDLHMAAEDLPALAETIARTPVPVVIDHMARVDPAKGLAQQPFVVLLELARLSHVWVKLTGADRITHSGPPYADVQPFAQALLAAAPGRMLWGTDWPHSGYFDAARMPDDVDLANLAAAFAPDASLRRQLLVDNPGRLFERR
jgi:predicted TIM-barrel fold metal-dependent hydrolase